jgi:O-antigen/teichoic acid export membrane protein
MANGFGAASARVKKLLTSIQQRGACYQVGVLVSGSLGAQLINVAASPIISRLYGPAEFGLFGVYTALFAVLLAVNSLRYEFAIALPAADEDGLHVLALTCAIVALTTLCFLGVALIWAAPIAQWLNAPALADYLWLLPVSLGLAGFYQALTYWMIRKQQFTAVARTKVVQSLSSTGAQIGFGVAVPGVIGLLIGQALSQGMGSWSLFRQAQTSGVPLSRQRLLALARTYRQMPLVSTPSSLFNAVSLNMPRLLVSIVFGSVVVGWFAFALQIISLPMQIVGQSVGQVFLARAAALAHTAPTQIRPLFWRTARNNLLMALLPAGVLLLFGPALFSLVFGPAWTEAGQYAQLLIPVLMGQFIVSPLAQVMVVVNKQGWQFGWDIARFGVLLALFYWVGGNQLGAAPAILLYSVTGCVFYLILFGLQWLAIRQFEMDARVP